jgi:hypothetical protein
VAARHTWRSQRVSTISRFNQSVWTKAQTSFGSHDFVNDSSVLPVINVVHQLGALIAKKAGVLKLCRAFHRVQRY